MLLLVAAANTVLLCGTWERLAEEVGSWMWILLAALESRILPRPTDNTGGCLDQISHLLQTQPRRCLGGDVEFSILALALALLPGSRL